MEGVFLSVIVDILREQLRGRRCSGAGGPVRDGVGLTFGGRTLVLCARPDAPGIWWDDPASMPGLSSPAWEQHLVGAEVGDVTQQGSDRVMELHFRSRLLYGSSHTRLVFEATGRNANLVLVRSEDGRILACTRKVTSGRSRYRTVVPGSIYRQPPSSGLPPGSWMTDHHLAEIPEGEITPPDIYRMLEGVGPVTARAVIAEASARGVPTGEILQELERALVEKDFSPWEGREGPLPVPLGPGRPLTDPLRPVRPERIGSIREDRLKELRDLIGTRMDQLKSRISRVEAAMEELVPAGEYRTWGNLLLSVEDGSRKGLDSIRLTDWEEREHLIPLKPSRTLRANAERFFRKAANAGRERASLESRRRAARKEIEELENELEASGTLDAGELEELLEDRRTVGEREREQGSRILEKPLSGGWRCFAGKNAKQNDEVTFRIGKRGDLWFHARGVPGAHVVLKLDGRGENPPARVIMEAAMEAARGSGASSGVVPVDYTRVQYVNRMKGGRPGQVVYTREKTIFVDLR